MTSLVVTSRCNFLYYVLEPTNLATISITYVKEWKTRKLIRVDVRGERNNDSGVLRLFVEM